MSQENIPRNLSINISGKAEKMQNHWFAKGFVDNPLGTEISGSAKGPPLDNETAPRRRWRAPAVRGRSWNRIWKTVKILPETPTMYHLFLHPPTPDPPREAVFGEIGSGIARPKKRSTQIIYFEIVFRKYKFFARFFTR